jgi:hypothetical protein
MSSYFLRSVRSDGRETKNIILIWKEECNKKTEVTGLKYRACHYNQILDHIFTINLAWDLEF